VTEPAWRRSRIKRLQIAAIAALGYPLIAILGRTLRWQVEGLHHYEALLSAGRPPIMSFWHGRILPGAVYFRRRGIVVITSQNFDGEWIARIIERLGFRTARGSSSKNASAALRQLMRDVRAGRSTAFTLDGPRGPARQAKAGAVWLAKATGCPMLPFHVEAARSWTMGSWDRAQIPKPFSRVIVVIGEPLDVPRDADEDGIERWRRLLEDRLAALEARARALAGTGA
jgi:lysophospholipid acyltransferase (LPLAT)-like uncharacterized protein